MSIIEQNTLRLQGILDKVNDLPDSTGGDSATYRPLKDFAEGNKWNLTVEDLEGATEIANFAFNGWTGIIDVAIPDSVKKIGEEAFAYTTLNALDLGNGVEEIEAEAFSNSLYLANVTIPSSVKQIGYGSFYYSQSTVFTFKGKPDSIHSNAFRGSEECIINVPWGENEVDGAPWGAESYDGNTINYNYTEN